MCGRFAQFSRKIEDQFKAKPKDGSQLEFKFNYAPSDKIKAVVKTDERELVLFNWGIINEWSIRKGYGLINIRDDTLIDKETFQSLFEKNRCLIIADGFYEWKKEPSGGKTPYYFFMKNKKPFAFAGLWNIWTPPDGSEIKSCAIITTKANSLVAPCHDRMPVILNEKDYDIWLNTESFDREKLFPLLKPYLSEEMDSYEVSHAVGSVKNDYEELIKPYGK